MKSKQLRVEIDRELRNEGNDKLSWSSANFDNEADFNEDIAENSPHPSTMFQ